MASLLRPDSTYLKAVVLGAGLLATATCTVPPGSAPDRATARLVFASDRTGNGDLYSLDGAGHLTRLTDHPAGDWDPSWSPDGQRLAFTSHRDGQSDIWLMLADGSELRNLTQHRGWDYWPDWSPDGRQIVFVSERDGDAELFIQAVDSPSARQLTQNTDQDRLPAWSPDGSTIAFASVREGVEGIYLIDADSGSEEALTRWPLRGTAPAWSPDGQQLAFVGWEESAQPGLYLFDLERQAASRIYDGPTWLGSLAWTPGGDWLVFTAWEGGSHDLFAASPDGRQVHRLTGHPAWDDFPAVQPGSGQPFEPLTVPEPPVPPTPDSSFIVGLNLADLGSSYLLQDLGAGWGKGYVNWETVEPEPGVYRWTDPDHLVDALRGNGAQILMRVHGTPAWARPPGTHLSHPPQNTADFAAFMRQLAARYRGQVAAYEIWNEPNLDYEWGFRRPDAAQYTALLKAAYEAVKAVDPGAKVIAAGLSTTGQGSDTAAGDLDYLQAMYDAGARGYFDALGSHPYGFGRDPEEDDPWGLALARVAQQREIMVANGDAATPVWITEMGWALATHWNLGDDHSAGVDELTQADYLQRALDRIQRDWPWIEAAFLFNLDFSYVSWYPAGEQMRWYAILNPDRTPRPAYTALRSRQYSAARTNQRPPPVSERQGE